MHRQPWLHATRGNRWNFVVAAQQSLWGPGTGQRAALSPRSNEQCPPPPLADMWKCGLPCLLTSNPLHRPQDHGDAGSWFSLYDPTTTLHFSGGQPRCEPSWRLGHPAESPSTGGGYLVLDEEFIHFLLPTYISPGGQILGCV